MDLKLYPLDRQQCEMRIASCEQCCQCWVGSTVFPVFADGWTTDDLIYKWKDEDPVQVLECSEMYFIILMGRLMQIVKDLNLPRFKLEQFQTTYCNTITNTGEYSCLKIVLVFK